MEEEIQGGDQAATDRDAKRKQTNKDYIQLTRNFVQKIKMMWKRDMSFYWNPNCHPHMRKNRTNYWPFMRTKLCCSHSRECNTYGICKAFNIPNKTNNKEQASSQQRHGFASFWCEENERMQRPADIRMTNPRTPEHAGEYEVDFVSVA